MSQTPAAPAVPGAGLAELVVAVDHVGLAVRDFDAAVTFHTAVLGLRLEHEEVNEDQGVREGMLVAGSGDTRIQLLAPLTPESAIARFLERSGEGVQQVALRVSDVEAAADRLRAAGVRVLYERARRGTAGSRVNFVHPRDCGGVLVELVQPAS